MQNRNKQSLEKWTNKFLFLKWYKRNDCCQQSQKTAISEKYKPYANRKTELYDIKKLIVNLKLIISCVSFWCFFCLLLVIRLQPLYFLCVFWTALFNAMQCSAKSHFPLTKYDNALQNVHCYLICLLLL